MERERALIAVVDDESMHLQIVSSQLQQAQYRVQTFSGAVELFGWMAGGARPSLIIMDLNMPVMDGIAALIRIREKFSKLELPVLLVTAMNQIQDLMRGFDAGANDYLHKPYNKYELLARVKLHVQLSEWQKRMEKTMNERTRTIRSFLDFSENGYLYIEPDLCIGMEYSKSAGQLFERNVGGETFHEVLPGLKSADRITAESVLRKVFAEPEEKKQRLFLELLPAQVSIRQRQVRVRYFPEPGNGGYAGRILVILSDITEQEQVKSQFETGQLKQMMLSSVIRQPKVFFEMRERFERFSRNDWNRHRAVETGVVRAMEWLRSQLEFFSGAWAGLHLAESAGNLHQLAESLARSKQEILSRPDPLLAWDQWLNEHPVNAAVRTDFAWLEEVAGPSFTGHADDLTVNMEAIRTFEQRLFLIPDPVLRSLLLSEFHRLYFRPAGELLLPYEDFLMDFAAQKGKMISPVIWKGLHLQVDHRRLKPLFQAMVHLFRNSVEHGIETLDERIRMKKSEFATIRCELTIADQELLISYQDDGKGIPLSILRQKLIAAGRYSAAQIEQYGDEWLAEQVFEPGGSTKDLRNHANEMSHGLLILRKEAESLGGHVNVQNQAGTGSLFLIWIPLEPAGASNDTT